MGDKYINHMLHDIVMNGRLIEDIRDARQFCPIRKNLVLNFGIVYEYQKRALNGAWQKKEIRFDVIHKDIMDETILFNAAKGRRVRVMGYLQLDRWEGGKETKFYIDASFNSSSFKLLDSKKKGLDNYSVKLLGLDSKEYTLDNYSVISIVGRLIRDAELACTLEGIPILKFGITRNYPKKMANGKWQVGEFFLDCLFSGEGVKEMLSYATKERLVIVNGRLQQDRWEGEKETKFYIYVRDVEFLDLRGGCKSWFYQTINNKIGSSKRER